MTKNEFVVQRIDADSSDIDTWNELVDGPKVPYMFVDVELCQDVYFEKGKAPRNACRVDLNGHTFWLFPGKNENVPEVIANIIFTSPENSKYAYYGMPANGYCSDFGYHEAARESYAPNPNEFTNLGGYSSSIREELAQNIQSSQQLQAVSEILNHGTPTQKPFGY